MTSPCGGTTGCTSTPTATRGWALKDGTSSEPEGYYDDPQEAIGAGEELAGRRGVELAVRDEDGTPRQAVAGAM